VNGIYWIYGDASGPLAQPSPATESYVPIPLSVVLCPRGGWNLNGELRHLKRHGVDTLVSLLSEDQVDMLGLKNEAGAAQRLGMDFLHHPIPDHDLPQDAQAFRTFVAEIAKRLKAGRQIGIHCWGSIGRAPLTAACTLVQIGWTAEAALIAVEAARGCTVPETEEQKQWVLDYKAIP
jgi:protein-tyrosine phosphatase